jgi:glutamin-(asparagin-)ase
VAKPACIVIVGTGGTIAGVGAESAGAGAGSAAYRAAAIPADRLIESVPGLAQMAALQVEQLFQIDSADFTDDKLLRLARHVAALCARDDVDGVVIIHGTDTLEESAYFLHLTLATAKPVVLTGAMRPSTALSADGPANLRDAVAVTAHPSSAGQGVLVVMNQEVFSARDVTKARSMVVNAFDSPWGPLGAVVEGTPRWYRRAARLHTHASEFDLAKIAALPLVGVVASHGNMRREIYDAWVAAGARAIVHEGFGGGTVPAYLRSYLEGLRARGVLLVRAAGSQAGRVIRNATADDDGNGWVTVDDQNAPRARLLTALALTRAAEPAEIQQMFWRY